MMPILFRAREVVQLTALAALVFGAGMAPVAGEAYVPTSPPLTQALGAYRPAPETPVDGLVPAPSAPETRPYPTARTPEVDAFVAKFTGPMRAHVSRWLERSVAHVDMIRGVLRGFELPEELAFMPLVESGFNPLAVSRAGAKGLWQFMAGTARGYGLRVDGWVDERLDPERSTTAAAAYLRDLYTQFGSWPLAKAAYNAGEVRISRAVHRTGSRDFARLARTPLLRKETKEFVPQVHAAAVIGGDPGRYGFSLDGPGPRPEVAVVEVPPRTSLVRLGAAAGVSAAVLRDLNPTLVRAITPPGARFSLSVPADEVSSIEAALERLQARAQAAARQAPAPAGARARPVNWAAP